MNEVTLVMPTKVSGAAVMRNFFMDQAFASRFFLEIASTSLSFGLCYLQSRDVGGRRSRSSTSMVGRSKAEVGCVIG